MRSDEVATKIELYLGRFVTFFTGRLTACLDIEKDAMISHNHVKQTCSKLWA